MNIENVLSFFKEKFGALFKDKVDSVIVVDVGPKLTLLNVELRGDIEVSALKIVDLDANKRNEIILKSLQDFIQENSILSKYAILKPSLSSLLIKRIEMSTVPDNELEEAIKWQLREDVPFDLSEAVLDFSIVKKTTKDDGSKILDIVCVITQEQEVKLQALALKQSGITLLSINFLPFAYVKLVEKYLRQEKDTPIAILHLADDICFFGIYLNNKLVFYRELPVSLNQLKKSLESALISDRGRIELTPEESEEVLYSIGVPQQDSIYKDKISSAQILSMLRPILERLVAEIKRSLVYYQTRFQGELVGDIFIAGQGIAIPNIDSFLSKELSLDIKKISLADKIKISSRVEPKIFAQSYASLGLALDYKSGINLLPREFRTEKIESVQRVSLRWTTFITFLILSVAFIFTKAGVGFYQKRLDNAKVHLNIVSEIVQIKEKTVQLSNFITEVRNSEIPIGNMLKKISNIAPRELFFNNFSLDCDSNTGKIRGYIKSLDNNPEAILTKFITDMKNSAYFAEANIVSLTKQEDRGVEIADFEISFKMF